MPPKSKRARSAATESSSLDESDDIDASTSVQRYVVREIESVATGKTWQLTTCTVNERDNYLRKSNEFSDVTFIVGDKKKKIFCHRVYLAKTSPTFASMFYGKQKTNDNEIKIPDVTPEAFEILLHYIYTGNFEVKKLQYDFAWEILYAARKFVMPDTVIALLHSYFRKEVMRDDEPAYYSKKKKPKILRVWPTVQLAVENGEKELLEVTWQHIEAHTSKVLKHDNFLNISPAILETLVKKDTLHCQEAKLFQACMKWANHEAERKNIDPSPENLRKILNNILPHIRFLAIDVETFKEGPYKSGLLTKSEVAYIISPKNKTDRPKTICSETSARKKKRLTSFYAFGEPKLPVSKINANKDSDYPSYNLTWVQIECDKDILVGVKIPSQMKNIAGNHSEYYQEDLTLHITELSMKDVDGDPKTICVRNFHGKVKYNSVIDIAFNRKVGAGVWGTSCSITVIFHKSGRYPSKCPDVNGKFDQDSDNEDVKNPVFTKECMNCFDYSDSFMTVYCKRQTFK